MRRGAPGRGRQDAAEPPRRAMSHWMPAGLVAMSLLLASCGAQRVPASPNTTRVASPTADAPSLFPTPLPLPYAFPVAWSPASGAPRHVSRVAFAPSSSQIGYLCVGGPMLPTTVPTPAPSVPVFYATHDGGQTWIPAAHTPFAMPSGPPCGLLVDPADPADVFVALDKVWRSRDGGATWHQLTPIVVSGWNITIGQLALVGTRLLAIVYINGEGSLPNPFYASDDGGATWHQIGQSIIAQQLTIGQLTTMGNTVYLSAEPICVGCAASIPASGRVAMAIHIPHSSNPPITFYFRSTDGGNTWTPVNVPGQQPVFIQAAGGGAYYGVSIKTAYPATAYFSRDSGTTWTALPTFAGVENGYLDPNTLQWAIPIVTPDGRVLVDTGNTGIFVLRPGDPNPAWRAFAPGGMEVIQPVSSGAGVRLWGVRTELRYGLTGELQYTDLSA
jgi:hypothetical protein